MVRSMENGTRERRLGMIAAQGGDVSWVPTVGATSGVQFAGDGSLVYQELSPDGKTREIKSARIGALPRVMWRDRDDKWVSPTNRDVKLLVSSRRQADRVRQRSQRLDPAVRDPG